VPPTELTLLVYTNTIRDYAFTVCRGNREPFAEQVVENHVAKAFRRAVEDPKLQNAVGAIGIPGSNGRVLAFRVFDAGVFHGRPHTLAVVAVVVPTHPGRNWSLSALLANLPCPTPGSDTYPVVEISGNAIPLAQSPFMELDEWDRRNVGPSCKDIACFATPPELTPTVHVPPLSRPNSPWRRCRLHCLALLIGAMLLGAGAYAWKNWKEQSKPPAPPPVVVLDDGKLRGRMEWVLVNGFFCTQGQVGLLPSKDLKVRVLVAESRARHNVKFLADELRTSTHNTFLARAAIVRDKLGREWENSPDLPTGAGETPSDSELRQALSFLEEYVHAYQTAKNFVDSPNAQSLDALQDELSSDLGNE
jgi:hypothetical protein